MICDGSTSDTSTDPAPQDLADLSNSVCLSNNVLDLSAEIIASIHSDSSEHLLQDGSKEILVSFNVCELKQNFSTPKKSDDGRSVVGAELDLASTPLKLPEDVLRKAGRDLGASTPKSKGIKWSKDLYTNFSMCFHI